MNLGKQRLEVLLIRRDVFVTENRAAGRFEGRFKMIGEGTERKKVRFAKRSGVEIDG